MFNTYGRNYDIYERELLSCDESPQHWRPYLGWTKEPFTILTDHTNLTYGNPHKPEIDTLARWHADLQEYDFKIKHIPGNTKHIRRLALSQPHQPKINIFYSILFILLHLIPLILGVEGNK